MVDDSRRGFVAEMARREKSHSVYLAVCTCVCVCRAVRWAMRSGLGQVKSAVDTWLAGGAGGSGRSRLVSRAVGTLRSSIALSRGCELARRYALCSV